MIGKDPSVTGKAALMGTAPGRSIIKQGLTKSAGYRMFERYRAEFEQRLPQFRDRFAAGLLERIRADPDPASTQRAFAAEVGSEGMALGPDAAASASSRLGGDPAALADRVSRILDSNFVKMTFPVLSALYDAAAADRGDGGGGDGKWDAVEGHVLAIDLSEPMDRIADADEDLEYLDDYRLMNPHILAMARERMGRAGPGVLESFEDGFARAREGQRLDVELKSRPAAATCDEMAASYAKYRAVMGTAGRNMALARAPLGEVFYVGMAAAAESVGCGNEMEDSLKGGSVKVPSWPLYYTMLAGGDVARGFDLALERSMLHLGEARMAASLLPEGSAHRDYLGFLFLTVEHYNRFWHGRLREEAPWKAMAASLPGGDPP